MDAENHAVDAIAAKIGDIISGCNPALRERLIKCIQDVLNRERFAMQKPLSELVCPICGCASHIRYGTTKKGTQRYQCSECKRVFCGIESGNILSKTKLDWNVWMDFAVCFVDGLSCDKTAARIGVSHGTAWFMRVRTLEALSKNLPSFEVKSGCGAFLDEIYFAESFKGVSLKRYGGMPRGARCEDETRKRGISNDLICVTTGINDNGDFFYDVSCRGALTKDVASDVLSSKICQGAIVNTDQHRSYPKVLAELGAAVHFKHSSSDHRKLAPINNMHSAIRFFMKGFHGVSTKWLDKYLAWFKWLLEFGKSHRYKPDVVVKQLFVGSYEHSRRSIPDMAIPFRDDRMRPTKV